MQNEYNYLYIKAPSQTVRELNSLGKRYIGKTEANRIKKDITKCMQLIEPWFKSEVEKVKLGESACEFVDFQALQSYLVITQTYRFIINGLDDKHFKSDDEGPLKGEIINLLCNFANHFEPFYTRIICKEDYLT